MKTSVDQALAEARRLAKAGAVAEAAARYREILAAFPGNKRARAELEKLGPAATGSGQSRPAEPEIAALGTLYAQGRLQDVVQRGNALAAAYPDEIPLHHLMGAANAGLKRYDEALACFARALELAPGLAETHFNIGIVHKNRGAPEAAVASYREAARLDPGRAEIHYNLGNALKTLGDNEGAIESYERAISLNPRYARALCNLGNAQRDCGRLDEAVASYGRAVDLAPGDGEIHLNLGNALNDLRRFKEAAVYAEAAVRLLPDNRDARGLLGTVLMRLGRVEEGLREYERGYGVVSFEPGGGATIR